jgi:hypothetical protein
LVGFFFFFFPHARVSEKNPTKQNKRKGEEEERKKQSNCSHESLSRQLEMPTNRNGGCERPSSFFPKPTVETCPLVVCALQ